MNEVLKFPKASVQELYKPKLITALKQVKLGEGIEIGRQTRSINAPISTWRRFNGNKKEYTRIVTETLLDTCKRLRNGQEIFIAIKKY